MTAEELLRAHITDKRAELVQGTLVVREPGGYTHGIVTSRLIARLNAYLEQNPVGQLLTAKTGFTLSRSPDTVRAPDIAFFKSARVPDPPPTGFPELAPDLVVDVLVPNERPKEILIKITDWLRAGTDIVWVFEPQRSVARIYRREGTEELIAQDGAITGEEMLPGFSCLLRDIFPPEQR